MRRVLPVGVYSERQFTRREREVLTRILEQRAQEVVDRWRAEDVAKHAASHEAKQLTTDGREVPHSHVVKECE